MEKSRWAVVAMLGILLAGGAVCPLGSSRMPLTRIKSIVADLGTDIIVVDQQHKSRFADFPQRLVIISESLDSSSANSEEFYAQTNADSVAWIVYTSGSSGTIYVWV